MNQLINQSINRRGKTNEWAGWAKSGAGKLVGNEQMQAEGKAQQLHGEAQQESAKTKERTKGTFEELGGSAKKNVGNLIGNEQMQAEGKAKETKGDVRKDVNK